MCISVSRGEKLCVPMAASPYSYPCMHVIIMDVCISFWVVVDMHVPVRC